MNYIELRNEYFASFDSTEQTIKTQLTTILSPIYERFYQNLELFAKISEDGTDYEEVYYIKLHNNTVELGDRSNYHIQLTMTDDIIPLADLVLVYVHDLSKFIDISSKYKLIDRVIKDLSITRYSIELVSQVWDSYNSLDIDKLFVRVDIGVWILPFTYNSGKLKEIVYLKQCSDSGHYGYSFNAVADRLHGNYYRSHIAAIIAAYSHCH